MKWRRWLLSLCLGTTTLCTQAAGLPTYSAVYAFGDSLSDNGNLYAMLGGIFPNSPPYFDGRFSNGILAVEYLAGMLNAPLTDYAVAGARTGLSNYAEEQLQALYPGLDLPDTGVLAQVGAYIAQPGLADPDALYFVWAGPNDYFSPVDLSDGSKARTAAENLGLAISALYTHGARHFLVPNMPDLGLTPGLQQAGAIPAVLGSARSAEHNAALQTALDGLSALAGIDLRHADVKAMLDAVAADPDAFGFDNVTDVCLDASACLANNGAGYLFWDDVHITTSAHARLAEGFAQALSVPEADARLMLLAGLGLLGGWLRRRDAQILTHS